MNLILDEDKHFDTFSINLAATTPNETLTFRNYDLVYLFDFLLTM